MTATTSTWAAGSAAGAKAVADYLSNTTLDHAHAHYLGAPELRPDLDPALATRLGIDQSRQLTTDEIAHLFNASKADGSAIDGKRINKPMRSLVETFGLDSVSRPEGEALANVLAGRRVDGSAVDGATAGAVRRFEAAMAPRADYERLVHATKAPTGGIDITFSADKSMSVAYALSSETDRRAILGIHQRAVADAMRHVETVIGHATIGAGGKDGTEPGTLAWVNFQHFAARPAVDIVRTDKDGAQYTDRREVPLQLPDPQIHSHVAILNLVHTSQGRLGSVDLDLLKGRLHEFGAVYHARIASHAAAAGIETSLGPSGETRLTAIPDGIRDQFSKRSHEARNAARDLAHNKGLDWDTLSGEAQLGLLKAGAAVSRNKKTAESASDFEGWTQQAAERGYHHQSVVKQTPHEPAEAELAYERSLPLIEEAFKHHATVDENELRLAATRGFIAAGGIGADPGREIEAVMSLYRESGIQQDGQRTALEWGTDVPFRGKPRISVTTSLHLDQERELIGLARDAAADRSGALSVQQIDQAADRFLARHPEIDADGPQWKAQRQMADHLMIGGQFGVGIGAAGSGKSLSISVMVDAWTAQGGSVYGGALAWRQSGDLVAAGIPDANRAAIDPFLKRAASGQYKLDSKSAVFVDEVSLLSTRQQLDLLRLQKQHGFKLVEVGDFAQLQAVEASAGIGLLRQVLGESAIPAIETSIRQRTHHEQELTRLWRDNPAEALALKRQDGSAILVPGGRAATVERVAQLWQESGGTATISTATNADVNEIGTAIHRRQQESGELGPDRTNIHGLALTEGDKVRVHDRLHDANVGGRNRVLANNGDVVTVLELHQRHMLVQNARGEIGAVLWSKTRHGLSYGYAGTLHKMQGVTSETHLHAVLDSTRTLDANAAYVAMSRHRDQATVILNEAAIRREVQKTRPAGVYQPIRQADIWQQASIDMSRKQERGGALGMLSRVSDGRRGGTADFTKAADPQPERQAHGIRHSHFHDLQLGQRLKQAMRTGIEKAREITHELREYARSVASPHQNEQQAERPGHSHRMSMGR